MNTLFCSIGDWALDVVRKEQLGNSDSKDRPTFALALVSKLAELNPEPGYAD